MGRRYATNRLLALSSAVDRASSELRDLVNSAHAIGVSERCSSIVQLIHAFELHKLPTTRERSKFLPAFPDFLWNYFLCLSMKSKNPFA